MFPFDYCYRRFFIIKYTIRPSPNDLHQLKDVTGQYYEEVLFSSLNIDGDGQKPFDTKGSINTET